MNVAQLRRLVGNPDVYAVQHKDGSWHPVREPLTDDVLRRHMERKDFTVGTYIGHPTADGTVARTLVLDIDSGDEKAEVEAYALRESLKELGVPQFAMGIEYSGRKGFHVWVVLGEYIPNAQLRRLGRAALALAGSDCEVYPKQDEVRDLGNLVKLPGGLHQVTQRPNDFRGQPPKPMPVALWENRVVPNLPEELHGSSGPSRWSQSRFPCMEAIQEGISEGGRNNHLFHLATMFRRHGATEETLGIILAHVNEKCDPPLDEFELEAVIRSSATSGPICDQVSPDRHCGESCIKARTSGLYMRPDQLRHAAVGENVVVRLGSRAGGVVTLEHDDLQTAKGALRPKGN